VRCGARIFCSFYSVSFVLEPLRASQHYFRSLIPTRRVIHSAGRLHQVAAQTNDAGVCSQTPASM